MYSKLILFFFQRNKISPPFSLAFKQRRKVLKNTTNIRFFFYMYERKRNFFRIVSREQRSENRALAYH